MREELMKIAMALLGGFKAEEDTDKCERSIRRSDCFCSIRASELTAT
jgi:hypothetical protein